MYILFYIVYQKKRLPSYRHSGVISGIRSSDYPKKIESAPIHTSWTRKEILRLFGGPPHRWRSFIALSTVPLHSSGGVCHPNYSNNPFIVKSTKPFDGSFVLLRIVEKLIQTCNSASEGPYRYKNIPLEGHPCTPTAPTTRPSFCFLHDDQPSTL